MSKVILEKLSILECLTRKFQNTDLALECAKVEKGSSADMKCSMNRMIKLSLLIFQEKNIKYNLKNLYDSLEHTGALSNNRDKKIFVYSTRKLPTLNQSQKESKIQYLSKGRRPAFSRLTREQLDMFFRTNPAPSKAECMEIKERTKLSYEQVRTWFNNKRRRTKKDENGFFIHCKKYNVI